MMSDERPARRIASWLRGRIADGTLAPGERVPSTRSLVREWGVAMATASRAIAMVRDEGLVVTRTGSGTVVRASPPKAPGSPARRGLTRARIVAAGIGVADREGLEAVSMRRLSGALEVTPMSLYHHIAGKDELEFLMLRTVFGADPLPTPAPAGWRERLETVYRLQWRLYRRHPWLVELLPISRPPLAPEAMLHSEWTLAALAQLSLSDEERMRAALALPSLVRGHALDVLGETRAERETGLRGEQWWRIVEDEVGSLVASGRFPALAGIGDAAPERAMGLGGADEVFDHALSCYLDGLALRGSG
ncbi:TetR/AcrR family transcriptional regulator C-terminal domain-containing protein [Saccharomonospora sp. NPDC006951]